MKEKTQSTINEATKLMANFAVYLRAIQSREQLSQDEMGERLGISRPSYRNYAHNVAVKEGGAPLVLFLRVAEHENISIYRLMEIISGDSPSQASKGKTLEKWKETLLNHFGFIAKPVRNKLINFLSKDKDLEVVFKGHRLTWLIDMLMLLADLPKAKILQIERDILELTAARTKNVEEQYSLNKRIYEVNRVYRSVLQ